VTSIAFSHLSPAAFCRRRSLTANLAEDWHDDFANISEPIHGFAAFAHNIQPWAWNYLNEHPELLSRALTNRRVEESRRRPQRLAAEQVPDRASALWRPGFCKVARPPPLAFTRSSEPAAEPCLADSQPGMSCRRRSASFRRSSHASPTFFLPGSKALRRANCSRALSNSVWIFLSNTGRSGNTVQYSATMMVS